MSSDHKKPVKLQVNTFGAAWRDVVRFDASNDVLSWEVMDAAERLGRMDSAQRTKFRVVVEDVNLALGAEAEVLTQWTPERGWKAVTHA